MKFHLNGAHRETAMDIEIIVDSESEESAIALASAMDIMVERVEPLQHPVEDDVLRYEYHTLRCDFRDLITHLNKYASDSWRLRDIHHDAQDAKSVYVVLERMHRTAPDSKY